MTPIQSSKFLRPEALEALKPQSLKTAATPREPTPGGASWNKEAPPRAVKEALEKHFWG